MNWNEDDVKLMQQIIRAADVMMMDAERPPVRNTMRQRAESIGHLARLVLERREKKGAQ